MPMEIKELPDFRRDWNIADKNIDLLEYVVHVADKFHPSFDGFDFSPSYDPMTFNDRYTESTLTVQQRYDRASSMGLTCTFEEYQQKQQYPFELGVDFKDKYFDEQLQNTIKAYGLDASKIWYLIVYVNDYVKDLCINAHKIDTPLLDELNAIKECLSGASELILKSNGKKIYSTQKKSVIETFEESLQQLLNNFNSEADFHVRNYELRTVNFNESETIEMSYRQYKFAEMLLYFLKDKKGKLQPNIHCKVYKEKHFFVSMLLYVVGLYSDNTLSAKNKWYEPWYNDKENRNLSNLVKNYKNRDFPHSVGKIYWK